MSLQQIEEELPKLAPEELERLQTAITALRRPAKVVATPEMMAERRRLFDEITRGEWSVELEGFEAAQAKDRECEAAMRAKWDE